MCIQHNAIAHFLWLFTGGHTCIVCDRRSRKADTELLAVSAYHVGIDCECKNTKPTCLRLPERRMALKARGLDEYIRPQPTRLTRVAGFSEGNKALFKLKRFLDDEQQQQQGWTGRGVCPGNNAKRPGRVCPKNNVTDQVINTAWFPPMENVLFGHQNLFAPHSCAWIQF